MVRSKHQRQVTNETVYVIYRNGKPIDDSSSRIVYTKIGGAKAWITSTTESEAHMVYHNKRRENYSSMVDWYQLPDEEQERLQDIERKKYTIVPYTPKGR